MLYICAPGVMKNVKLHIRYNPYFAFKNIIGILGKELLLKRQI